MSDDTSTRHSDWVTNRNSATIWIHFFWINIQKTLICNSNNGKGFVNFPLVNLRNIFKKISNNKKMQKLKKKIQTYVVLGDTSPFKSLWNSECWCDWEINWKCCSIGESANTCKWSATKCSCLFSTHQNHCTSTIVQCRCITSSDCSIFLENCSQVAEF